MTVREALNGHKGEIIKLGADAGFIYCDINDETTEQTLTKLDANNVIQIKISLKRTLDYIGRFNEIWTRKKQNKLAEYEEETEKRLKKGKEPKCTKEELLERLEQLKLKDFKQKTTYAQRLQARQDKYIPFLDREVREIYKACYGETIILFKGLESGDYWTVKEYRDATKGVKDE